MTPYRVQLRRVRGWRMPADTVSVARSTRWGNPYRVTVYERERAIELYRIILRGDPPPSPDTHTIALRWWRRLGTRYADDMARVMLRGRNLACWCAPYECCHADVLLEVANR